MEMVEIVASCKIAASAGCWMCWLVCIVTTRKAAVILQLVFALSNAAALVGAAGDASTCGRMQ
jgi:hypothetical protein